MRHYFFLVGVVFFGAFGLENVVLTVEPNCVIRSLAEAAFGPSGFSSRYFCNASIVPGAGTITPFASAVAFAARNTPY